MKPWKEIQAFGIDLLSRPGPRRPSGSIAVEGVADDLAFGDAVNFHDDIAGPLRWPPVAVDDRDSTDDETLEGTLLECLCLGPNGRPDDHPKQNRTRHQVRASSSGPTLFAGLSVIERSTSKAGTRRGLKRQRTVCTSL